MFNLNVRKETSGEKIATLESDETVMMEALIKLATIGSSTTVPISIEHIKQAITFACKGQKIHLIKLVREITGLGLKESKDIMEAAWVEPQTPARPADWTAGTPEQSL